MSKYELSCNYDSRKSFYGKARVIVNERNLKLYSYNTKVAEIDKKHHKAAVNGTYSNTTLRHIKEFLRQNGFKADTSKQILEDYKESKEQEETKAKEVKEEDEGILKSVGLVASMGDIFCKDKKDKNDWKLRMLKAGLENRGLSIPDDWNTLTEVEKEKRLNGVIDLANKPY